eukprot:a523773_18.p3 GENE.a523773_18~~a523773_18.p3  ORF type:complete len:166 (-),score=14.54 a523773_18:52-507(-)
MNDHPNTSTNTNSSASSAAPTTSSSSSSAGAAPTPKSARNPVAKESVKKLLTAFWTEKPVWAPPRPVALEDVAGEVEEAAAIVAKFRSATGSFRACKVSHGACARCSCPKRFVMVCRELCPREPRPLLLLRYSGEALFVSRLCFAAQRTTS